MKLLLAGIAGLTLCLSAPGFAAGPSPAGSQVTTFGTTEAQYCFTAAGAVALSNTALDEPRYREAVAQCTQALAGKEIVTDRIATFINRGTIEAAAGFTGAAVADYDAALALAPARADIYVDRGVALFRGHQPQAAEADYTRALELAPITPELVYFDRAMAREDAGDLQGAYADYRRAMQLRPDWNAPRRELSRFTVVPARPIS